MVFEKFSKTNMIVTRVCTTLPSEERIDKILTSSVEDWNREFRSRRNEGASWNEMQRRGRYLYRERSVERMEFAGSIALYIGRRAHNLRFVAAPLLESSPGRKTKEREREGKREGSVNGEGHDDEAER